jgi:plasmid stabilization system protein ParE
VNRRVLVRPQAELDMLAAATWYEAQRPGLGTDFLDEITALVHSLADNALIYAEVTAAVRRAAARRFPYVLSYRVTDSAIVVLTVLHMRRQRR